MQIEKDVIRKNSTRIDYNYIVGYQVMIRNKAAYKYETPFKDLYEIFQMWTNGTVTLWMGAVTTRINIHRIKPYNNIDVEWLSPLQENINIHVKSTYIHVTNKYMLLHIYIYTYIYNKVKSERFFIMGSFLFHTKNNSFHDIVIYLVQ